MRNLSIQNWRDRIKARRKERRNLSRFSRGPRRGFNKKFREMGVPRLTRQQWRALISLYQLTPKRIRALQGAVSLDPEMSGFKDFLDGALKFVEGGIGQITGSTEAEKKGLMQQQHQQQMEILALMKQQEKESAISPEMMKYGALAGGGLLLFLIATKKK
ncbi:MAG: hypothetical protein GY793_10325 [Proteobacteria bacterium]|nr:hypothetical protein [Pseudomonadota bacterium]